MIPTKKVRLDQLLFQKKLCLSREQAQALILSGKVKCNQMILQKPGVKVDPTIELEIEQPLQYVSRGGVKMEGALSDFNFDPTDMVVLDIGSSTGGFADCLLQNQAKFIYCVDVGYGQLAWKLRNHEQIEIWEKTNARYLEKNNFEKEIDLVTMDVSFISICKILPAIEQCLKKQGHLITLMKPQFEVGKEFVEKGGVVRNIEIVNQTIELIIEFAQKLGFNYKQRTPSKIKGPKGNQEYFLYFTKESSL